MSSCWSNHRYIVVLIESKRRLPPLSNQFRHLMCFDVMWFHTPSNRLTSPLSDDFSVFFWFLARSTVLGFILFANGWFETMNLARVWLKMMRDLRTFDCLRLLAITSLVRKAIVKLFYFVFDYFLSSSLSIQSKCWTLLNLIHIMTKTNHNPRIKKLNFN